MSDLLRFQASPDAARATLRVHCVEKSEHRISPYVTGKFCEHLGSNIYNGMHAQVLRNPTFAVVPFGSGRLTPDGRPHFLADDDAMVQAACAWAKRLGWPDSTHERIDPSYRDGLAVGWLRSGPRSDVVFSADVGPNGGRAQRVQTAGAEQGIGQCVFLPLHRVRRFEFSVVARGLGMDHLVASLCFAGSQEPVAQARLTGLSERWTTRSVSLSLPDSALCDAAYELRLLTPSAGQLLVARALLYPADHIDGADPDVVRLLKESRLPLLRWPGGNFVSGYHFEDGIGSLDERPTRPNWAWGDVEPNLFGTDEFIAFCRAVGCEPMICVNTGDGTPEEAARWVEYCNGSPRTPMGARRAANGHVDPYGVRLWEVGNELWGRFQVHWTTSAGYLDRYRQFSALMRAADPDIRLYACGAPVLWGKDWNDALFASGPPLPHAITDHPLIGGVVPRSVEPLDVYRDFMAVPVALERRWHELEMTMRRAGVERPEVAITELQLFARLGDLEPGRAERLTAETLVRPQSMAEAIYDVLFYHVAVRLAPFTGIVTHSATVNHGGGLHKQRERVYAAPCHYAQSEFAEFANAAPVVVDLACACDHAPLVLADLKSREANLPFALIDALAARADDGSLLISLVHRGVRPISIDIALLGFVPRSPARLRLLTADAPWIGNSLADPTKVVPSTREVSVERGRLTLELAPYSVAWLRFSAHSSSDEAVR